MKTNYHDYVIKDDKFIGAFEEMYQNIEDPWNHGDATDIHYDMALYLIKRYKLCTKGEGFVLDIGCGKAAFTARLRKTFSENVRITAIDIAPTAIRKAKEKYGELGIDFRVCDVIKEYDRLDVPSQGFDLIIMSDLMWYILPHFENICNAVIDYLKNDGYLLIKQTFYSPEKQKYGKNIISCVEDMVKLINLELLEMIETNRLVSHHTVVLFKNIK